MTNLVLDTRTATDHFPGIGRYAANLARAMPPLLHREERLVLLCDRSRTARGDSLPITNRQVTMMDVPVSPFGLRQQWAVPRILDRLGTDVYHSPYYLMPYWPGVPTVLTMYDLIPILFPDYASARARLLFRWATALALRRAKVIIAISRATQRDVLRVYGVPTQQVEVIPLAADPVFSRRPAHEQESVRQTYGLPDRYALYLGSNKPHKNLVRLVEAWSQLQRSQDVSLVIAGAWDSRYCESKRLAMDLGLDSVRFLGLIRDGDLAGLYSGAMLFVFPSEYEGFGLPVLEAMACGTPVLCSKRSSLPEVAGDAALYFDPIDANGIAHTLERAIADQDLRHELQARGLERASQFSWKRTAEETLALYRGIQS